MKTTIGGDRLGSGNKQEIASRNYERSTHDLSYLWRSSMSAGTLVPFLNKIALPGDSFEIDLKAEVVTLPTVGPLFGSYKVQLDVFEIPMRLWNAKLHMNRLGVGMDMGNIFLPQIELMTNNHADKEHVYTDNSQINPSCLLKYLGMSGLGAINGTTNPATREFNAIPLLNYWSIYKNYYSNKQEEIGYIIHTNDTIVAENMTPIGAILYDENDTELVDIVDDLAQDMQTGYWLKIYYPVQASQPDTHIPVKLNGAINYLDICWDNFAWDDTNKILTCTTLNVNRIGQTVSVMEVESDRHSKLDPIFGLKEFPLENIDMEKDAILQMTAAGAYTIEKENNLPYSAFMDTVGTLDETEYSMQFSQEGLAIKTFQSDLFQNWISTEWIDGASGINEITAVDTTGDSFTIDALNIANKVYMMLNRIAVSGGTYDDWLDAVYSHERVRGVESPVYHGSLIKELAFEEVVSNSETEIANDQKPLGTLAGRGRLTGKNKGGRMTIKVNEPSYIMGIVSLTPRIDYSQGNEWDMNLKTYDDFHKPALDAIGFQDLITEQLLWSDTTLESATGTLTTKSLGKQPAWINYMTSVNKVYGNFADQEKEMFMTLNRRYEANTDGSLKDGTTYIDPTKFNQIFARSSLDSQNFWMQIAVNMKARRKMSAKVIPNL